MFGRDDERDIMDELAAIRARKMEEMMGMARSPAKPAEVSDATFNQTISSGGLVVVDCWAEWCGPCRMLAPVIEQLAKEYAGRVTFAKLNVDDKPATAARFRVMSIPTLLVFKDSKLVDTIIGAVPKTQIESTLRRHL